MEAIDAMLNRLQVDYLDCIYFLSYPAPQILVISRKTLLSLIFNFLQRKWSRYAHLIPRTGISIFHTNR